MKSPFAYMWKAHSYMWKSHSLTWWTSDSGWIILQFKSIKIYFSDQVNAWKYRESVNHRTILDSVGPFCPNYSETGKLVWTLFLFLSATHSLSADVTSLRAKCVLHVMEVVFGQMETSVITKYISIQFTPPPGGVRPRGDLCDDELAGHCWQLPRHPRHPPQQQRCKT